MGNNAVYHGYAGMPDDAGRVYSEELCELEADRAATLGVRVVRTLYKWYAWDAEKQVWNWESEKMQAFYRWLDRLKNAIFRLRYKLAGLRRLQMQQGPVFRSESLRPNRHEPYSGWGALLV